MRRSMRTDRAVPRIACDTAERVIFNSLAMVLPVMPWRRSWDRMIRDCGFNMIREYRLFFHTSQYLNEVIFHET